MGNVLRVFKRDVLRLLKAPCALVVVIALLVLPSVYTWYNVVGFWNPYDNTGNLRVCVVNEDAGASSELTGELHVGDMIVEELRENEQLDWAFVDRATAMDELDAGASYAAVADHRRLRAARAGLLREREDGARGAEDHRHGREHP